MPSDWPAILDDLEARVDLAEAGELHRLGGWLPLRVEALPAELAPRARAVLARQRALEATLIAERARVLAAMAASRRPRYAETAPVPRYIDASA